MGLLPGAAGCGMHWQPLLDTASHVIISKKELSAWAIGVDTDKLLCVLCKTSAPEPRTTPKPVQTTLVLSAPLLGRAAAPGRIEQEDAIALKRALLEHMQWCFDSRIDLFADDSPEKASGVGSLLSTGGAAFARAALERASTDMDKALLRQFQVRFSSAHSAMLRVINSLSSMMQAACKEEKDFRAFDIVQRLRSPKSVDIAIKVAQQARRTALAQLLYNIRHTLVPAAASPQWQGPSAVEPVPSAHVAEVTPPDRAMVTAAPEPAVDSITAYLAKVPMRQLTREGSTKPTSLAGPTPQAAKAAAAVPSSSKTMASPSKPTPADGPSAYF